MLRLERRNYQKEVSVTLRNSRAFVNRTILHAFLIALTLHLAAFFLFRVHTVRVSTKVLPKMVVEAIPMQPLETNISLPKYERSFAHLLTPDYSKPQWPNSPGLALEKLDNHDPFSNVQDNRLLASLAEVPDMAPRHRLEVKAFGELFQRPLTAIEAENLPVHTFCLRYLVQVDDKTGQIFWCQLQEGGPEGQQFAENLMGKMRFGKIEGSFVSKGEIEITLL